MGKSWLLPWVSPARLNHWDIRYRSWEVTEWCKRTNPIFVNALSNRIAGVQITNSSGGIGASSSIQIRGQNFVGGYNYNNSPLFVVDGVPISNNNEQSTRSFTGRQDYNNPNFTSGEAEVDYGNAAGEINQEDIESVFYSERSRLCCLVRSTCR